jgi:hypothetical protein
MGVTCSACHAGPKWASVSGEPPPLNSIRVGTTSAFPALPVMHGQSNGSNSNVISDNDRHLHHFSIAIDSFRVRGVFAADQMELRLGMSWGGHEPMLTSSCRTDTNFCQWDDSFHFSSSISPNVLGKKASSINQHRNNSTNENAEQVLSQNTSTSSPTPAAAVSESLSKTQSGGGGGGSGTVDIVSQLQDAQHSPGDDCLVLTCFERRPYRAFANGQAIFRAVGQVKVPLSLVVNGPIHHEFSLHGAHARDWRVSYNVRVNEVRNECTHVLDVGCVPGMLAHLYPCCCGCCPCGLKVAECSISV